MSTRVMSDCWPLQMPPPAKSVLISLADNANDQGHCWPSIDTISMRTCFKRTAVIEAIKWLEANGYLVANRENGRKTTYQITVSNLSNQSATRTGTPDGPVRHTDQTSPPDGLDQSARRTLTIKNRKEPSKRKSRNEPEEAACPDDVDPQVFADFQALRRKHKAVLTQTALKTIRKEAEKAGLTLQEVLEICCVRGWRGFQAVWVEGKKAPVDSIFAGAL